MLLTQGQGAPGELFSRSPSGLDGDEVYPSQQGASAYPVRQVLMLREIDEPLDKRSELLKRGCCGFLSLLSKGPKVEETVAVEAPEFEEEVAESSTAVPIEPIDFPKDEHGWPLEYTPFQKLPEHQQRIVEKEFPFVLNREIKGDRNGLFKIQAVSMPKDEKLKLKEERKKESAK